MRDEFKATDELCRLCKAGLTPRAKSANVKVESLGAKAKSLQPWEALGGMEEVSDLDYTQ
jgi:hypothetical protein